MKRREIIQKLALAAGGSMIHPMISRGVNSIGQPALGALENELLKESFGEDFLWGVATAAYQIEGAHDVDGKGPSIWDTFVHQKKTIKDGSCGDISCNFYVNYFNDLLMVQQLGFDVFRFSLSWSRLIPEGTGKVNQKGVDFYNRVIDSALKLGIQPWITLYHWDLPQALEDKGGWLNRDITGWFEEYVSFCANTFGDRVKNWMVLNEPLAFTAGGYLAGIHAPGKKGLKNFLNSVHHAALCQADGGRILRDILPDAKLGTTLSCSHIDPVNDAGRNENARRKMDAVVNRLFTEPLLGMGYPIKDGWDGLRRIEKYMKPGDEERLKFDFDFIGLQNYTRMMVKFGLFPPVIWAKEKKAEKRDVEFTEMGWEVYPEGIYKVLMQFSAYENMPEIIVTENGAAFPDTIEDAKIHDQKRVEFFKNYLSNVLKAKRAGANIGGYFVWTLMDNFEWAEGFGPRFGLVYIDWRTQARYIKDSGYWFQKFLK